MVKQPTIFTHKTLTKWKESKYGHNTRRKYIEQPKDSIPNIIYILYDAEEPIISRFGAPIDKFGPNNCYFELEWRMLTSYLHAYGAAAAWICYIIRWPVVLSKAIKVYTIILWSIIWVAVRYGGTKPPCKGVELVFLCFVSVLCGALGGNTFFAVIFFSRQ